MNRAYGTPSNNIWYQRIKIRCYKTKPSLRLCKKTNLYFVGLQQFQGGVYIIRQGKRIKIPKPANQRAEIIVEK